MWILNIHLEIFGTVPEVNGSQTNESQINGSLMVCNHRNFTDPVILSVFLEVYIIAKAEVANMPVINKAVELTGIIYVKREEQSSRKATRETLIKTLKEQKNVLIFAEGTVCNTKDILPLRYGSFVTAAEHGIEVIPIAMEYRTERDLWMANSFLAQHLRQFGKWRTDCRISFGAPIIGNDGELLHDETEAWIGTRIQKMQSEWSKAFN